MSDKPATRSTLLELREERQVVNEGYRFLDEKRVALAQEMLRRLNGLVEQQAELDRCQAAATVALAAALERHGLEGLQVQHAVEEFIARLNLEHSLYLGLQLIDCKGIETATTPAVARTPSPEGARCAHAFRVLTEQSLAVVVTTANLLRMSAEYQRTERRVRALENIILPEVSADVRRVQDVLDEQEQEEMIRARRFAQQGL